MVKKTIDVWLCNDDGFINNYNSTSVHWSLEWAEKFKEKGDIVYKATLLIEVPERKIEITKSMLNDALHHCNISRQFKELEAELTEALFGECDDL